MEKDGRQEDDDGVATQLCDGTSPRPPQIGSLGRLFGFMVRGIYYANMTWRACSQRGWW